MGNTNSKNKANTMQILITSAYYQIINFGQMPNFLLYFILIIIKQKKYLLQAVINKFARLFLNYRLIFGKNNESFSF